MLESSTDQMPIDDPISALEVLDRSDERQRSPLARFRKPLLAVAKLLGPPGTELAVNSIEAAAEWLNGRAESNIRDFINVFAGEIKYCTAKIQKLLGENENQRKFIEDELPGLTVDALRRAEQCRARERVARLARILSHAASVGAADGADVIEGMMDVATRLSELDVLVLGHASRDYQIEITAHPREAQRAVAARAWQGIPTKMNISISEDELVTVGSRLESFGLATKVETGVPWETSVFGPLEAGLKFIEYIQSTEGKQSQ